MRKFNTWRFSEEFGQVVELSTGRVIVDCREGDLTDKELRLIAAAPQLFTCAELSLHLLEILLPIIREFHPDIAIEMIKNRDTVSMLLAHIEGETIDERAAREKDEDRHR
jgi:hypothetical protein